MLRPAEVWALGSAGGLAVRRVLCLDMQAQPPPLLEDEHGVIGVGGTRVSLESVVIAFDRGASAEEIVESLPTLGLATVYSSLAFVLNSRSIVDEYLLRRRAQVDELRAEAERRFPAQGLRARLLARRRSAAF